MSESKHISSVPVTADVSHLLALKSDGSLGKIAGSKFPRYVDVSASLASNTTIELTDFLNQFVQGASPGTLIFENQYAEARKRVLKIGSLSFNLQKYDCMVLRAIGGLSVTWSNLCVMLIPAREGKMYFLNVFTTGTLGSYSYSIKDAMGSVVVAETTVQLGGG